MGFNHPVCGLALLHRVERALATATGTAAIHLALDALGVGQGDVVIGSSFTFIGSCAPAVHMGARLTFLDSERESWNLDPDLLAGIVAELAKELNLTSEEVLKALRALKLKAKDADQVLSAAVVSVITSELKPPPKKAARAKTAKKETAAKGAKKKTASTAKKKTAKKKTGSKTKTKSKSTKGGSQ